ncbi:ribosome recycling factor [Nemania sp. NC0429]|nr:ribosome recycling factor [Nemania sp. NC0429]
MNNNVAARILLRQGLARSQTRRTSYHDVVTRTSVVANTAAKAFYSTTQPTTCPQHHRRPLLASPAPESPLETRLRLPRGTRAFHASPAIRKAKKNKDKAEPSRRESKGRAAENNSSSSSGGGNSGGGGAEDGPRHPQPSPEEPLNFADVESRLRKEADHFKAAFKKVHAGGRFDPDVIGGLSVAVDRKAGTSYPLRELAQVVPRGGRAVSLLVHEADHVRAIMSAVQASPEFNQQPQRDPDNELELVLKVQPETRDDLVRRVRDLANDWTARVRLIRQKRDKTHVAWKKAGAVGADMKFTADKELDKLIKSTTDEIERIKTSAVKAADSL